MGIGALLLLCCHQRTEGIAVTSLGAQSGQNRERFLFLSSARGHDCSDPREFYPGRSLFGEDTDSLAPRKHRVH